MKIRELNEVVLESAARGTVSGYEWPEDAHNAPKKPNPDKEHMMKIMAQSNESERTIRNLLHNRKVTEGKLQETFRIQKDRIALAINLDNDITRLAFFPEFLAIRRICPHFDMEVNREFDFKTCAN